MLSLLKFFAHDNKYAYVEFNTLENQYTVQNYRYYATNQHRLFAQPQENELVNTFFFAFVTAARMSFVLIFRQRPPRQWNVIIDILPESDPLLIHVCMVFHSYEENILNKSCSVFSNAVSTLMIPESFCAGMKTRWGFCSHLRTVISAQFL